MAPGSQDFEVSTEGQQGAALQAQEPLCAGLKLARTYPRLGCNVQIQKNLENTPSSSPGVGFPRTKAVISSPQVIHGSLSTC